MRICGVGSAFQKNYSSRNVIREALKNHWSDKLERPQILDHLHSNVGVQGRHLTLPIAAYEGLSIWGKANNASIQAVLELGECAMGRILFRTSSSRVVKSNMTKMAVETDVFVVGGGPAGLAVAIAARNRGFSVTVADIAQPPIDKACAEGIMPDGLAALRKLGVNIPLDAASSFQGIRFSDGESSVRARFAQGPGLGIRRTKLHEILIDKAAASWHRHALGGSRHWLNAGWCHDERDQCSVPLAGRC